MTCAWAQGHDLSMDSDHCLECALPVQAWGPVCNPSTDDSAEACAEIRHAARVAT